MFFEPITEILGAESMDNVALKEIATRACPVIAPQINVLTALQIQLKAGIGIRKVCDHNLMVLTEEF